ncbi:MAG: hypothetical protein KAR42_07090 [candidate division Zixibacteria bacterium]|nr:hypothetical protein [candidate division Zixibacteria bacterium]
MKSFGDFSVPAYSKIFRLIMFVLIWCVGYTYGYNAITLTYPCSDTLYNGVPSSISVSYSNDDTLSGFYTGFKIWSPDGAIWNWNDVNGYGQGGLDSGKAFILLNDEGRMSSPNEVWDLTGLVVNEYEMDNISPDVFSVSGEANSGGLPPGQNINEFSFHFIPNGGLIEAPKTICIDSVFVPPSGSFIFNTASGPTVPLVSWVDGGMCFVVSPLRNCGPSFDQNLVNISTNHCYNVQHDFQATWDENCNNIEVELLSNNGLGGLSVIAYEGSGHISYSPSGEDIGDTVQIVIGLVQCPEIVISTLTFEIEVTGIPPLMLIGNSYNQVGIGNLFQKDDILAQEDDICDTYYFLITSGPGSIDLQSGLYTLIPTLEDIGEHWIVIEATDSYESRVDSFHLTIIEESNMPGNASCGDGVNVGDAVSIVNYVFRNGYTPPIVNWADANGDCQINIGDAVYLINYIFRGGAAPLTGCVN